VDEKILIKNAKQGDNNAFNSLLKPYVKQAQQTAYLLLHDYALAQDAGQEALIQTHSSLKRFEPNKASFKTWFNRIVVNCSLKQKRKQKLIG
jgi:RNA polymerase sigma-70 factor (ECF subfamily)